MDEIVVEVLIVFFVFNSSLSRGSHPAISNRQVLALIPLDYVVPTSLLSFYLARGGYLLLLLVTHLLRVLLNTAETTAAVPILIHWLS